MVSVANGHASEMIPARTFSLYHVDYLFISPEHDEIVKVTNFIVVAAALNLTIVHRIRCQHERKLRIESQAVPESMQLSPDANCCSGARIAVYGMQNIFIEAAQSSSDFLALSADDADAGCEERVNGDIAVAGSEDEPGAGVIFGCEHIFGNHICVDQIACGRRMLHHSSNQRRTKHSVWRSMPTLSAFYLIRNGLAKFETDKRNASVSLRLERDRQSAAFV
jgi:hypothetical protein